jgi:hypothetical protein
MPNSCNEIMTTAEIYQSPQAAQKLDFEIAMQMAKNIFHCNGITLLQYYQ